jgi:hypothetical protein
MSPKRKHSNAEAGPSTLPSKRRRTPSYDSSSLRDTPQEDEASVDVNLAREDEYTDTEDDPIDGADGNEVVDKKGVVDYTEEEWEALEKTFIPQIDLRREKKENIHSVRFPVWLPHSPSDNVYPCLFVQAAAESGIIQRVELVQFMCHKNLTFDFGDQLNFIIGP